METQGHALREDQQELAGEGSVPEGMAQRNCWWRISGSQALRLVQVW